MLKILHEFRKALDEIMLQCMHDRIAIYGYDSYTGRFLKWYASYYHGIEADWLISEDMSVGKGYDREVFRPSVFDFGYKDIKTAVIWLAQPLTENLRDNLQKWGYEADKSYFDFYRAIYGTDKSRIYGGGIQFLAWLEHKYGCDFLTTIEKDQFKVVDAHGHRYSCSTQKEIFPMLDRCHVHPSEDDGIFDFGCGKGGAMISFLDYGFSKVGGVEYEPQTYDIAQKNFASLGIEPKDLICGDARQVTEPLDAYNWFYFFFPFDREVFETVIGNIKQSYMRRKRKMHIIYFTAMEYDFIEKTGIFRLSNQFTVDSRQRVVGIFESFE